MRRTPLALWLLLTAGLLSWHLRADGQADELVRVELEAVYPEGNRPRPEPAVVASAHDAKVGTWNLGGSSDASPASEPGFHPAVRVLVATQALRPLGRRGLTDAGIQAQTRSHGYWPLRLCYEAALREGPSGPAELKLRFSIARSGRVSAVRTLRSALSRDALRCVGEAVRGLRFRPAPQARVDVDLSVKFSPGDVPVLPLPTGSATANDAERAAIAARLPEVRRCYAAGLQRDPALWGRLELELLVAADGRVRSSQQVSSAFPDAGVRDCVRAALLAVQLPAEAPERRLRVAYRLGALPEQAAR